jgi:hypothetical protein
LLERRKKERKKERKTDDEKRGREGERERVREGEEEEKKKEEDEHDEAVARKEASRLHSVQFQAGTSYLTLAPSVYSILQADSNCRRDSTSGLKRPSAAGAEWHQGGVLGLSIGQYNI